MYGRVVTGTAEIETVGRLHYDTALRGGRMVAEDTEVVHIAYLHVTVRVTVTSAG